ncbi:MAG: hypothetical protein OXG15_04255 [Gammaproteobacteria bacterium]|nr:hypothetical protein [Gammaproteobacteria bacterium]
MKYWWDEAWDELCLDAWERLGVYFGDMPIVIAFTWGRSVAAIEGTHTNIKVQKLQNKKEKQKKQQPLAGSIVAGLGGNVSLVDSGGYESDYWARLREKHINGG